jgi:hypothetical protein
VLNGDSDVLWCDFLIDKGVLGRTEFTARNADMAARYRAGTVGAEGVRRFLRGHAGRAHPEEWEPLRQEFLRRVDRAAHHAGRRGAGRQSTWRPATWSS